MWRDCGGSSVKLVKKIKQKQICQPICPSFPKGEWENTSKILLFVKLNYLILNQFVLAGGAERKQTSNNPNVVYRTTQLMQNSYSRVIATKQK